MLLQRNSSDDLIGPSSARCHRSDSFRPARITFAPPELVSFLGTFIVFIGFAYPMRKLVIFKLQKTGPEGSRRLLSSAP